MIAKEKHRSLYLSFLIIVLAALAISINEAIYNYPGNNYFPPNTFIIGCSLLLMYAGFILQLKPQHYLIATTREIIFFFGIMCIIALVTNAVQYTPFPPIDEHILKFEVRLGIKMPAILAWLYHHPTFKTLLNFIYDSLPYQMTYIPLALILFGKKTYIREYYFLLLISALMGFSFYYFFPTTAPASIINSDYFSEAQHATELKFIQIHQHIAPTTLDGGLIALPSFHAIWAWLCLYAVRGWPIIFFTLLPVNCLLILSCVLLGWHYFLDIVSALILIFFAHIINDIPRIASK